MFWLKISIYGFVYINGSSVTLRTPNTPVPHTPGNYEGRTCLCSWNGPKRLPKGSGSSWGWKSLLSGREAIMDSMRWSIGNGQNVNIRTDKWLKRGLIGGPANRNDPQKVSELMDFETEQWNASLLHNLFDEQTTQEILAIPINRQISKDELIWTGSKDGAFTVKSGYNTLRERETASFAKENPSSSHQTPRKQWNALWKMQTSPKVRIFIWNVCQNAVPSKENLWKRKILPDPICDLCRESMETVEHLHLLCPWTAWVWSHPEINLLWK